MRTKEGSNDSNGHEQLGRRVIKLENKCVSREDRVEGCDQRCPETCCFSCKSIMDETAYCPLQGKGIGLWQYFPF